MHSGKSAYHFELFEQNLIHLFDDDLFDVWLTLANWFYGRLFYNC